MWYVSIDMLCFHYCLIILILEIYLILDKSCLQSFSFEIYKQTEQESLFSSDPVEVYKFNFMYFNSSNSVSDLKEQVEHFFKNLFVKLKQIDSVNSKIGSYYALFKLAYIEKGKLPIEQELKTFIPIEESCNLEKNYDSESNCVSDTEMDSVSEITEICEDYSLTINTGFHHMSVQISNN